MLKGHILTQIQTNSALAEGEKTIMKKTLIAGAGVAALAAVAAPVAGVFAATSSSFSDNITVNVPDSCTIENSSTSGEGVYADRTFNEQIAAGSYARFGAATGASADAAMTVKCNGGATSTKTWTLKATADNAGQLKHTNNTDHIDSGPAATSGTTSTWAMKINVTSGSATTNPFSTDQPVPTVADTTALTASAASGGQVNNVTFQPEYQVYVAPDQTPGDYSGKVTYTVTVDQP